jgi:hypothetical protein
MRKTADRALEPGNPALLTPLGTPWRGFCANPLLAFQITSFERSAVHSSAPRFQVRIVKEKLNENVPGK